MSYKMAESASTQYWWNQSSLHEELSRLANFTASPFSHEQSELESLPSTSQISCNNGYNNIKPDVTVSKETIKAELEDVVRNTIKSEFAQHLSANEEHINEEDKETLATNCINDTTTSTNSNITSNNMTTIRKLVHLLASHLLQEKRARQRDAQQFAEWSSITTNTNNNTTTSDINNNNNHNNNSSNSIKSMTTETAKKREVLLSNADDINDNEAIDSYAEAYAQCFDIIFYVCLNIEEETHVHGRNNNNNNNNNKAVNLESSKLNNNSNTLQFDNNCRLKKCDAMLKQLCFTCIPETHRNFIKLVSLIGVLHLFHSTLSLTSNEINTHFPLMRETIREEWQACINDWCNQWVHSIQNSNNNNSSSTINNASTTTTTTITKVEIDKANECLEECTLMLDAMHAGYMFSITHSQISSQRVLCNKNSNNSSKHFYTYLTKKLHINTISSTALAMNTNEHNTSMTIIYNAIWCTVLSLLSYKEGMECLSLVSSMLLTCNQILLTQTESNVAEINASWEKLREAAHRFAVVFTPHPQVCLNMLSYIDLLATVFWTGNAEMLPKSRSTKITQTTTIARKNNSIAMKEANLQKPEMKEQNIDLHARPFNRTATTATITANRIKEVNDDSLNEVEENRYKAYKSCLIYLYEMHNSNANSKLHKVDECKPNHLAKYSNIKVINLSNTFVTNALTSLKVKTKAKAVTTSTITVKMLSYTLLHSPLETLHNLFDLLICDDVIRKECRVDKIVSCKDDFVRRSAAYVETDCSMRSDANNNSNNTSSENSNSDAMLAKLIFPSPFYDLLHLLEDAAEYIDNELTKLCVEVEKLNKGNAKSEEQSTRKWQEEQEEEQEQERLTWKREISVNDQSTLHKDNTKNKITLFLAAALDIATERYFVSSKYGKSKTNESDVNNKVVNNITATTTTKFKEEHNIINNNSNKVYWSKILACSELLMFYTFLTRSKSKSTVASHANALIDNVSNQKNENNNTELKTVCSALQVFFTPQTNMLRYLHNLVVNHKCYGVLTFFIPLLRALGVEYSTVEEYNEMGVALPYPAGAEVSYLFELPRCFFVREPCKVALNMQQNALDFIENTLSLTHVYETNNEHQPKIQEVNNSQGQLENNTNDKIVEKNNVSINTYATESLKKQQQKQQQEQEQEEEESSSEEIEVERLIREELFIDMLVEAGKVAISRLQRAPSTDAKKQHDDDDNDVGQWIEQSISSDDQGCSVDVALTFFYGMLRLLREVNYWPHEVRAGVLKKVEVQLYKILPSSKTLTPLTYLFTLPNNEYISKAKTTDAMVNNSKTEKAANDSRDVIMEKERINNNSSINNNNNAHALPSEWVEWFWQVNYDDVDEHPSMCAKTLLRTCNLQYIKSIPTKTLLMRRSTLEQHNTTTRANEASVLLRMETAIANDMSNLSKEQQRQELAKKANKELERGASTNTQTTTSTTLAKSELLMPTELSNYTHRVLTTLLQRARMSAVDGALSGVAFKLFIIHVGNKYIQGEELIKLIKRFVYLITVRIPFATVQETISFTICLHVIAETVMIPFVHYFMSETREAKRQHDNNNVIKSTNLLANNKLTLEITHALVNDANLAIDCLNVMIDDICEAIRSCLHYNSRRGDWNAYYVALHTGSLTRLTKRHDDTYKRLIEARRQVLVTPHLQNVNTTSNNNNSNKNNNIINSNNENSTESGVESFSGFMKLVHLERPLLFHLTNPASSLFELFGVKEPEGNTQKYKFDEQRGSVHHEDDLRDRWHSHHSSAAEGSSRKQYNTPHYEREQQYRSNNNSNNTNNSLLKENTTQSNTLLEESSSSLSTSVLRHRSHTHKDVNKADNKHVATSGSTNNINSSNNNDNNISNTMSNSKSEYNRAHQHDRRRTNSEYGSGVNEDNDDDEKYKKKAAATAITITTTTSQDESTRHERPSSKSNSHREGHEHESLSRRNVEYKRDRSTQHSERGKHDVSHLINRKHTHGLDEKNNKEHNSRLLSHTHSSSRHNTREMEKRDRIRHDTSRDYKQDKNYVSHKRSSWHDGDDDGYRDNNDNYTNERGKRHCDEGHYQYRSHHDEDRRYDNRNRYRR